MKTLIKVLSLTIGLGFTSLFASGTDDTKTATPPTTTPPTVTPHKMPDSVKALVDQFKTQRATLVEARKAALEAMKNMTEAERKAALQALFEANKALLASQRDLAKQIRDAIRAERKARQTTGG
jgi:hypothetical protein